MMDEIKHDWLYWVEQAVYDQPEVRPWGSRHRPRPTGPYTVQRALQMELPVRVCVCVCVRMCAGMRVCVLVCVRAFV